MTCRLGRTVALDALTMSIDGGKVTGIIGPNGAGKTTLLDVVCGLLKPDSGRVKVLGHDLAKAAALVRARIGVVPQETALYDELTPLQNLELSAALYAVKDPKKRIDEVLALVDLTSRKKDRVGTLSGGMQRRLAIARALLHEPDLLLLDEPTLGVDVEARHQIWNHVRKLREQGRAIVLATNYLDEAEALCDDVAVLRAGKIVARDAPAKLAEKTGRCLDLDCSEPDVEKVRDAVSVHPNALRTHADGARVSVYFDAKADPDEIVRTAMAAGRLDGFRVRSPDLMEVLRTVSGDGA